MHGDDLPACTAPFSLSVLTATKGHASKKLVADVHGQPIKDPAHHLGISAGRIEHVQLHGLIGLRDFLATIRHTQALVHGVPKDSLPGAIYKLVTDAQYRGARGTIARTLKCLAWADGVHLLMLDYDPEPEAPHRLAGPGDLITRLSTIWPAFSEVGWLATTSTSSAIKSRKTHEWLKPPEGMHVYLLVTGDVERWKELATVKLWLTGEGYCKLATPNRDTGVASILMRALIDLTVFSPERLDYVAGAVIKGEPFYQDQPPPALQSGCVLDLDRLPDITDDERQAASQLMNQARQRKAPEQRRLVREHIAHEPTPVDDVEQEIDHRLERAEHGELEAHHPLYFDNSGACTAGTLTAAHDDKRLADPLEPDYGPNQATCHWRKGDWRIVSWAHGVMRVFRLVRDDHSPPPPDDDDVADLLRRKEDSSLSDGPGNLRAPGPCIQITPHITAVVNAAELAIIKMPNGPHLYRRASRLAVIARSGKPPKWMRRPESMPTIITPGPARIRELMAQSAVWEKFDKREEAWAHTLPPAWAVETLLDRTQWNLPPLEGVLCAPTLRPDGSLLTAPGYDVDTGLYLALNGTIYPPIPTHPTIDDARTALGLLQQEIFHDFPFTPARRGFSAAVAALLSIVVRYIIDGPVPLMAARSTIRGSGKGLLIDGICVAATGSVAPRWAQTTDDNEERKRLMSIALAGDVVSHIDNVVAPLGTGPLDSAITAQMIADRTLGVLERQVVPLDTIFFASGNNMAFQGDMARRIITIDLDPQTEHPEDRDDFQYADLKKAIRDRRPALVIAALTIMRAYFEADCPEQDGVKPLGSFESWSRLIRQAMIWAGEDDPCDGRHEIEAESDPQYESLNNLLVAWHDRYGTTPTPVKQVTADLDAHTAYDKDVGHDVVHPDWRDLHAAVIALDKRGKDINGHLVGNALRKWKGRLIDGKRFCSSPDKHTKMPIWHVESNDALK